ncbi:SDR family oxidoreductase [Reyranella sp.]|uniref:SDR family oxidoreductase n=1 Tax=Reyranella sp. TaxID=1929291 RepID=UPI00272FBDF6|nr:SDR family oxidoreductase [Reyranella sp.]MDP2377895.1 SDR family oxidoreductase [Reyranella sp.]
MRRCVNAICPSMTETGMIDGMTQEKYQEIVSTTPMRRAGRPGDIAGACLFLASELSAYIAGTTIDVNGGSHIHCRGPKPGAVRDFPALGTGFASSYVWTASPANLILSITGAGTHGFSGIGAQPP